MPDGGGIRATAAPDADDLPDPTPADARRAVIDAARHDGLTCQRGAFEARRTYIDPDDHAFGTIDPVNVVLLSLRVGYGGDTIGIYPVHPTHDVRTDWTHPTPDDHERGDAVLPAADYGLGAVFVDPAAIPGGDGGGGE
jgi:hypothetical protein